MLAPEGVKTKFACVEYDVGYREPNRICVKKVKKATRKRALMVACKGMEKLKRSEAGCKIESVIADLQETACPKKTFGAS